MSEFEKMEQKKWCLMVGKTSKLLRAGYSAEEIAETLGLPIQTVAEMIDCVNEANEIRNKKNG